MSVGTFTLIKNEAPWIAAHLLRILPFIDQVCLFDGNSTDGTLEIIEAIKQTPFGHKIKLVRGRDPKNLQEDYVRIFNECMWSLDTDLAWFLHPDMYVLNPEQILCLKASKAVALKTRVRSFAGEPGGQLFEIIEGRGAYWKNIYRLRNPDLGAHYHGFYGAVEEDVYFSEITGDSHEFHGQAFDRYPYEVDDSGLEVWHFSDVRPLERRIDRMVKCCINQGSTAEEARAVALAHPRVTFKDGQGFKFIPSNYPGPFSTYRFHYSNLERQLAHA